MRSVANVQLHLKLPGRETIAAVLAWYDRERRDLPWRPLRSRRPDAYAVWLSEIMLQQTTVKAVIPYYETFLARWPTVEALAEASLDDVLAAWAGLGYYSRARNLHKCAKFVAERHGGRFPAMEAELLELPGIGPYTAAAIAAIAFGASVMPVDGNIERVMARLFAVKQQLPAAKAQLRRLAQTFACGARSGDCAQALMDLGATVCTPKRPSCLMCPIAGDCAARAQGIEALLPVREPKSERPSRVGLAYLALREDGCVLLRRRPEAGLLGGMLEVPSTDWNDVLPPLAQAMRAAPVLGDWWAVPGTVVHVFTHFRLEMLVYRAIVPVDAGLTFWADSGRCRWVARHDLHRAALPSVMRKIIAHGLTEQ
jgi:A/G-specific adenine glycosylase